MPHEEWRPVVGFEDAFEVSDQGRVRSKERWIWTCPRGTWFQRKIPGRVKSAKVYAGYPRVTLSYRGKDYYRHVHRLVAEAFLPKPEGADQVNHKTGNRADNRVSNLEWCSSSWNRSHAFARGLQESLSGPGEQSPAHKLTEADVRDIKQRLIAGEGCKSIAKDFPVGESAIGEIKAGRSWTHVKVGDDAA